MPNASRSPRTRCTCLSGPTRPERRTPVGEQHQAGVAGQLAGGRQVDDAVVVQLVELGGGDVQLGHPGVAAVGVADRLGAVLLGVETRPRTP